MIFHPWTTREWVDAANTGNVIYIRGGRNRQGELYDEIMRIDIARRRISTVGCLPSPRFVVGIVAIQDNVYIVGGFDGEIYYDDILMFGTDTEQLRMLGRLPNARAFGGVAGNGTRIYYAVTVRIGEYLYLIRGAHERFQRQLRFLQIHPETGKSTSIQFRSFLMW